MRVGIFPQSWWAAAASQLGVEGVELEGVTSGDNPYSADLASRLRHGRIIRESIRVQGLGLLIDNGGAGLTLVAGSSEDPVLHSTHEVCGVPLCSHFIDPLVTALGALDWKVAWPCLQSPSWIKAVWDRAQVLELERFGVPGVLHLPLAAPNRTYDTRPLNTKNQAPVVSFIGGQNCTYFSPRSSSPTSLLVAGVLAQAGRLGAGSRSFLESYHDRYGVTGPMPWLGDVDALADHASTYFRHKLFFNAAQTLANRDRFVLFLSRRLGPRFRLHGHGWRETYGLPADEFLATSEAYLQHFRDCAINLNLVSGNAETGLNMRHFEITAAGGFMLCQDRGELAEQFDVGRECAVFRDEDDLLRQIDYYLARPEERAMIASAGQRRTLSQHLFGHRLRTLMDYVERSSASPPRVSGPTFTNRSWWQDMRDLVPAPRIILDCGANVGQMTAAFHQAYPGAELYAFEPVQALFEQLERNCASIGARAVRGAVADRTGKARIHLTSSPEANSLLGYQEGNPCARWTQVIGEEGVVIWSLDDWCREARIDPGHVDIIKLDVQGSELLALYGARSLLRHVRLVYLEVSFVPIYQDCPLFDEVDRFLKESGFQCHALYPSDQPRNWADALYVKEPFPSG